MSVHGRLARLAALAAFPLGLLLVSGSLTPGAAQEIFGETIDVSVVNLEVVVTDGDGLPVLDLGPDDFRLWVDGEETPIGYFTPIRGGVAVRPQPVGAEGAAAGPGAPPSIVPGEPVPTSYLLFIDESFAVARDRDRVLETLTEQLPLLAAGDRMAVVAFDGSKIEMLSSWTGSTTRLRDVLLAAREREARGLHRLAELRFFESTRSDFDAGRASTFDLSFEEQQYARELSGQVERAVLAAAATLRGFASPPGRKVMLLLSGGWPFSPARYTVGAGAEALPVTDPGIPEGEELFGPLVGTANRLGYTLYPVDLPGLDTSPIATAAEPLPGASAGGRFSREREQEQTLLWVAEKTGGRALLDAGRTGAFETAVADTRSYYWLGFEAPRSDGREARRIRVEVDRPGARVRLRDAIGELSRQEQVSLAVESALLFGSPPGFDTLGLEAGEPRRAGRRFVTLPVTVAIPTEGLTLLPEGDGFVTRLELRVAAVSARGETSEVPVVPLGFRLAEKPGPHQHIPYETEIRLRRQEQRLVVAVYDVLGSTLYSNVLEIDADDLAPGTR